MMQPSSHGPWVQIFAPRPAARARLLCVPYAGGGAALFREWGALLPPELELGAVRLPGREGRFREPPLRRMERLIGLLVDALLPLMDRPFALLGHSLGALVAFELARALRRQGLPGPVHLFVAGRRAPQLPSVRAPDAPPLHQLPDAELLAALRQLDGDGDGDHGQGGGPAGGAASSPELLELMLPTVRADFELGETYRHVVEPPLACPITALGGAADPDVPAESLAAWQAQTRAPLAQHLLPGGHFFLHAMRDRLLEIVAATLAATPAPGARP